MRSHEEGGPRDEKKICISQTIIGIQPPIYLGPLVSPEPQLLSNGKKDPVLITSTKIMTPSPAASPSIKDRWIFAPHNPTKDIRDGRNSDALAWPVIYVRASFVCYHLIRRS
jgi:hypothetical protein